MLCTIWGFLAERIRPDVLQNDPAGRGKKETACAVSFSYGQSIAVTGLLADAGS